LARACLAAITAGDGANGPEFLFDVGRSADTSFCSKSRRDRWYEPRNKAQVAAWSNGNKVMQAGEKRLGDASLNLSSRDIGVGARELEEYTRRTKAPVEFEASPHSRRSILDQQVSCSVPSRFQKLSLLNFALLLRPARSEQGRRWDSLANHCKLDSSSGQLFRTCGALIPPFPGNSNSAAGPPGSTLIL